VVEKDEDGFYVGEVPQFRACYSQGRTIDELLENMKEVIQLALEEQGDVEPAESVIRSRRCALCVERAFPCRFPLPPLPFQAGASRVNPQ